MSQTEIAKMNRPATVAVINHEGESRPVKLVLKIYRTIVQAGTMEDRMINMSKSEGRHS